VGRSDDKDRDRAARLVKAMGHPLRARVLTLMQESGPISGVNIARDHGLGDFGNVSYHVGVLEDLEAVELTETRSTNGSSEYLYDTTPFGDEVVKEIEKDGGPPAGG
jgi:DNA-binding transcriptional ArsR family regulator